MLDGGIISGQVNETAMGDGQLLTIETGQLVVREGSGVSVGTLGAGNAGDLTILASESVEVSSDSILSAQVNETATGDGGDLTIETGQLVVQDGGFISVATLGDGEAGRLTVNASNSVEVVGGTGSSGITASTLGSQPAGNILMTTGQLIVRDNAVITTATSGAGNAGDLLVDASEAIVVSGSGGLNTRVEEGATGEGGDLTLTTGQLVVQNGAQIAAGTFGREAQAS